MNGSLCPTALIVLWGCNAVSPQILLAPPGGIAAPDESKDGSLHIRTMQVWSADVSLRARVVGPQRAEETLVVLHGGPGFSYEYTESLEDLAGPRLAVVRYEQRGVGESTSPALRTSYAFENQVADLEALRTTLGVPKIHILGHSWGAILAEAYALQYPDRVDSMVLVGASPPDRGAWEEANARMNARVEALKKASIIGNGEADWMHVWFYDPGRQMPDEILKSRMNWKTNEYVATAIGNFSMLKDLTRLTHRVLLLWGEGDPQGSAAIEVTKQALQHAAVSYHALPKCGHFWQECQEATFAHVAVFLPSAAKRRLLKGP